MRLLVAAICLLTSAQASAGAYMEIADKDLDNANRPVRTNKIWAQDGAARMETQGHVVIFKSETMYMIDDAKKQYTMLDKAQVERMASQMTAMQAQAAERMKQLPPEQRAQMEKMMAQNGMAPGGAPKAERTLKQTSRTDNVNGKACTVWEASEGPTKTQELCVAPYSAVAGSQDFIAAVKGIGKMVESMKLPESMRDRQAEAFKDVDKLGGVPVLTRDFEGGKAVREHRLVTSRSESVPATSFAPPAGYKAQPMPELGAPGARP
jgi:hypothetical protein